jgi:hypothetical protein
MLDNCINYNTDYWKIKTLKTRKQEKNAGQSITVWSGFTIEIKVDRCILNGENHMSNKIMFVNQIWHKPSKPNFKEIKYISDIQRIREK